MSVWAWLNLTVALWLIRKTVKITGWLLLILLAVVAVIYIRSRGSKVDHNNVNDEWQGGVAPAEPQPAAAA